MYKGFLLVYMYILMLLRCFPSLIQLERDVMTHGPVLAVLTVIGGLDMRPRLGGLVQHEELGMGTIAKIESKSKVVVLFHGMKTAKMCPLITIKPVRPIV